MRTLFSDVFSKFPHTAEALWELVLALWRLKVSELDGEESEEDVLWEEYVSAWLVSVSLSNRGMFC